MGYTATRAAYAAFIWGIEMAELKLSVTDAEAVLYAQIGGDNWLRVQLGREFKARSRALGDLLPGTTVAVAWMKECTEPGAQYTARGGATYKSFGMWCHRNDTRIASRQNLTMALAGIGVTTRRDSAGTYYCGFRLRGKAQDSQKVTPSGSEGAAVEP